MATDATPKKKAGRPKTPPPPPALGIAERSGEGYKLVAVVGGLKINGKKYDPQEAADLVADMLAYWMQHLPASRSEPSPEPAIEDLGLANPAESDDGDHHATNGDADVPTAESSDVDHPAVAPELAMEPGQDGANGNH